MQNISPRAWPSTRSGFAAFASFRIIELPEEKIEEKNASDAVVKKALDKEGKAILSNVRKGARHRCHVHRGQADLLRRAGAVPADRANSGQGMWPLSSARPTACPMR